MRETSIMASAIASMNVTMVTFLCLSESHVKYEGYLCDKSPRYPGTLDCLCFVQGGPKLCLKDYMRDNNYALCRRVVEEAMVSRLVAVRDGRGRY